MFHVEHITKGDNNGRPIQSTHHDNYRQDEDFWKNNPYGWKRWQAILDFMDAEDHVAQLPAFKEYIETLQPLRNIEFTKVFPELSHLL